METITITEEPTITEGQFRAFYRAIYLKRKNEDIEKYKEQKKRYNAVAYAKKLAKQKELKQETPLI